LSSRRRSKPAARQAAKPKRGRRRNEGRVYAWALQIQETRPADRNQGGARRWHSDRSNRAEAGRLPAAHHRETWGKQRRKLKLKYIQKFADRYGRARYYLRKPGHKRVPLPPPGTRGFLEAYEAALANEPEPVGVNRTKAGTMAALAIAFLATHDFRSKDPSTQAKHRGIVERIVGEHGHKKIAELRRAHIEAILHKKAATPVAANDWLRILRRLMRFAVAQRLRDDDPTVGVQSLRYVTQGHETWSEEHVAKFEAVFPIGSMARLAMALMVFTGCRVSDALVLGRQHIRDGLLTYTQHKNRNRKPVTLTIPVHPELARIIEATPAQHMTFLASGFGRPFKSAASLGMWMKRRCCEAGLPDVSSHGLRKACARRLAEAGCTPHQIGAITGHTTLKQIENYTKAADQKRLAVEAMRGIR
jgi:integrase